MQALEVKCVKDKEYSLNFNLKYGFFPFFDSSTKGQIVAETNYRVNHLVMVFHP